MRLSAAAAVLRRVAPLLALSMAGTVAAEPAPGSSSIYSCDVGGKRVRSDRPIPECATRPQQILNPDGSLRGVLPPSMTVEERDRKDAADREEKAQELARQVAIRRDRDLLARFPNEAAHRKAREAALDDVQKSVRLSESRVALLIAERKPLLNEAEFYVGKPLPTKLKSQLDANDAAAEAQRSLIQNQQSELVRINQSYDAELEHLKKLWARAQQGSLSGFPSATALAGSAPTRK